MSSSLLDLSSEPVCYLQCNFCNTILAVSVPCSNASIIVTVRCGHCSNLLSVNMPALLHHSAISPHHQHQVQREWSSLLELGAATNDKNSSSSSTSSSSSGSSSCSTSTAIDAAFHHHQYAAEHDEQPAATIMTHIRPPEKRQRVPSAYNRFIKEEIQRIKASNPEISHREAFSTAAKNWAHFPHIQFGLKVEGNKQANLDHPPSSV